MLNAWILHDLKLTWVVHVVLPHALLNLIVSKVRFIDAVNRSAEQIQIFIMRGDCDNSYVRFMQCCLVS